MGDINHTCNKHDETMERIFNMISDMKIDIKLSCKSVETLTKNMDRMQDDIYSPEKGIFTKFAFILKIVENIKTKVSLQWSLIIVILVAIISFIFRAKM